MYIRNNTAVHVVNSTTGGVKLNERARYGFQFGDKQGKIESESFRSISSASDDEAKLYNLHIYILE